ncbi:MAG: hypothetical protein ACUVXF_02285 [Desulfobaccales bacterium]
MRSIGILIIFWFFWGPIGYFPGSSFAAPAGNTPRSLEEPQVSKEITAGQPPVFDQVITLDPFFFIRKKDTKVWVERILVAVAMLMPKDTLRHDCNTPALRQLVYEMLQSGEPEETLQTRIAAGVQKQVGQDLNVKVHLSRDILIVR